LWSPFALHAPGGGTAILAVKNSRTGKPMSPQPLGVGVGIGIGIENAWACCMFHDA